MIGCKRGRNNKKNIDYNKLNNKLKNLCILCPRCNSKVNKNREFWKNLLSKMIEEKEGCFYE